MELQEITEGLLKLLHQNNYNDKTIAFYKRMWKHIDKYLVVKYGDHNFDIERGLNFLESKYNIKTKYNDGTLSRRSVQLLRVVHILEDYRIHKVLTRRCKGVRNPIKLLPFYERIYSEYIIYLENSELSKCTINHYSSISKAFLDFLKQKSVLTITDVNIKTCNCYLNTLAGFGFKTIEQQICGLRHFLRFLRSNEYLEIDLASEIHMPNVSKTAKIPSAWDPDDLDNMLKAIDKNSPIGKRDYAMILLACVLGIRSGDIKKLRFENIDWNNKKISFVQHKTKKPITLPMPDAIGWAIIDYIKNGRPNYFETDYVFLKHMPPFDPFPDNDHLYQIVVKYMNKAGIRIDKNRHSGFHSLRHSAGSMLLDMGTPLPVITSILGHSDMDTTGIYLKTDLQKLKECVLPIEV